MQWTAPQKFTLKRWCMLSMLPPTIGANRPTPALFTRISMPPNSSAVLRISPSTARRSVTSVGTTRQRAAGAGRPAATASSFSRLREARTTDAPRRASSRAVSRPMPVEAPVMMAVRPSMRIALYRAHGKPVGHFRPEAADGVLSGHQAHVAALEHDILFVFCTDDGGERGGGRIGGDVVVLSHDVQDRAGDGFQVDAVAAQHQLARHQLVIP